MEVNKLEGKTLDGVSENVSVLAQAFPEVIVDGKVDFEKLRLILGEDIEDAEERYSFMWPGKRDAIKLAISRTTGTLRPDKENSKDWDTTQNLFIEGDNLEVLRVLQNTYRGKVKMIYIDPPYNTGKDFVYKDDFKDNIANYKEQANLGGQSNADTTGRYHTNWLNMMYPRLRLAKNLLRDDGVIFMSIDDNEAHNLRKLGDEIFGEDNFVGNIVWRSRTSISNDHEISMNHNHTFIYSKKREKLSFGGEIIDENEYSNPDNDPRGPWKLVPLDANKPGGDTKYAILNPNNGIEYYPPNGRSWAINSSDYHKLVDDNRIKFGKGDDSAPKKKLFLIERLENGDTKTPTSVLLDAGTTKQGTEEVMGLFDGVKVFDYPKPTELLNRFITYTFKPDEDGLVLDFFAGSATTAHAVINYNATQNSKLSFITVQLPEDLEASKLNAKGLTLLTLNNAIAFLKSKNKPLNLAQLSMERIRRSGEKVKADYTDKLKERTSPLDVGFKAFKLDTTNFREWDTDTEDINASLLAALDTFKEGRTSEDALYEVLLKYGVDLTEPVEVLTLDGKRVYSLAGNYLLVCLEKNTSLATVEEMAKLKPTRVVCYDDGFENDEVKQNALETLKRAGVEDVRVI